MVEDQDIKLLCALLTSQGRSDLVDVIAPGHSYLESSGTYGSYLNCVLGRFLIYLPLERYLQSTKFSDKDRKVIFQNVLHLYPVMEGGTEITSVEFLLDKELANIVDAPVIYNPPELRVFISYSTTHKAQAGKVKAIYDLFKVPAFLAHEDLQISVEWRDHIIDELKQSSVFVVLLSKEFRGSDWTSQEIGMAAYNPKAIFIPLRLDETIPYGFISHIQGAMFDEKDLLGSLIVPILRHDLRIVDNLINYLSGIKYGFRECEIVIGLMEPYFARFSKQQVDAFLDVSINNGQISGAGDCISRLLPKFLEVNRQRIELDKIDKLRAQVDHFSGFNEQQLVAMGYHS